MTETLLKQHPETVDRLKILKGNRAYPSGGTCKICGFSDADLPGDQQVSFRFSDVCGLHDCRVKAGVCDCIACQKLKKADIERQIRTVLIELAIVKNLEKSDGSGELFLYQGIAERAEKLLQFEAVSSD